MVEIDCDGLAIRQINSGIRDGLERGQQVTVLNPGSRHNLGVGINHSGRLVFDGGAGYYCAGMLKFADVEVRGNCGWSVGEDMMSGSIVVRGNCSAAAGAAIRGGTLVVHGNTGPRAGISQKGGSIVIGGSVGYMAGFMMQKGVLVICGDTGDALGDSLYEGTIYVGGKIEGLGNDAVEEELTEMDMAFLEDILTRHELIDSPATKEFTKIVSGKKLYNFDKQEFDLWR